MKNCTTTAVLSLLSLSLLFLPLEVVTGFVITTRTTTTSSNNNNNSFRSSRSRPSLQLLPGQGQQLVKGFNEIVSKTNGTVDDGEGDEREEREDEEEKTNVPNNENENNCSSLIYQRLLNRLNNIMIFKNKK